MTTKEGSSETVNFMTPGQVQVRGLTSHIMKMLNFFNSQVDHLLSRNYSNPKMYCLDTNFMVIVL